MPIAYRIDQQQGVTYVVFDHAVTDEEFIAHTERLMADPDWPPRRKLHLTDVTTQVHPHQVTEDTIRRIADMWGVHEGQLRGMRLAVVANEAFKNATTFEEAIAQYGPTIIVFNLLPTACAWLGLDLDTAERALEQLRGQLRGAESAASG